MLYFVWGAVLGLLLGLSFANMAKDKPKHLRAHCERCIKVSTHERKS